jgi:UDPglucose 6-dehydrogenase
MKIAVAGAGFVGLVHASVLAKQGHEVILFDVDENKIKNIESFAKGETHVLPIFEDGLEGILRPAYREGLIKFTTDAKLAIKNSEVIFIAVGTPQDETTGEANLTYVDSVAKTVGEVLKENPSYKLVVDKSTVPIGTAERVKNIIKQYYSGEFDVASNPETLAEGSAVQDSLNPNRVIIGVESERAKKILTDIYAPFFFSNEQNKIHVMGIKDAEMSKYAFNTFLASQVRTTNVLANIARKAGADWRKIIPAVLGDVRIGHFVHPGLGFGGSCFRKDVSALHFTAKKLGAEELDLLALSNVLKQNENQKMNINKRLTLLFGNDLSGMTIAIWGLAFKKDTNDVRDAASLVVIPDLLKRGATVHAHDPQAGEDFIKEMKKKNVDLSRFSLAQDKYSVLDNANCLIITNDWRTYRRPDFEELKSRMKQKIIFDGKDLLDYELLKQDKEFRYYSIGRPDLS